MESNFLPPVLILIILGVVALLPIFVERHWRLFLAVPLSVFQVYVPGLEIHGYPPPLALLGALALWPEFLKEWRLLLRWPPTLMLVGILLLFCISLCWSVDLRLGVRAIVYLWAFLAIFCAFMIEARENEPRALSLLAWTIAFALIEVALVIVCRLSPELESAFLHSQLAQWFINPNSLHALYGSEPNNVLAPSKAGGFFLNGNVAGAYLAMLAATTLGMGIKSRNRWLLGAAMLLLLSVYFSGSKAAIILVFILSLAAMMVVAVKLRPRRWWLPLIMVLQVLVYTGLQSYATHGGGGLVDRSSFERHEAQEGGGIIDRSRSTLNIRLKIWGYGLKVFPEHALLGQGFGGWQQGFPQYAKLVGIGPGFPPHNTLIYLWSQGGLLAALFGLGFMLFVVGYGVQLLVKAKGRDLGVVLAVLAPFLLTFIHGLGTNFGLVGEMHITPLLAALLALAYVISGKEAGRWTV
jgi:O-antigen ligase